MTNACFVAGQGIKGNQVIGASDDEYGSLATDLATGLPDEVNGDVIRPADVHATVLTALDMDLEHISNQEPKIITKMLV